MHKRILAMMMAMLIGCSGNSAYLVQAQSTIPHVVMGEQQASTNLTKGIYTVPVAMKNASNLNNASIAAGCLVPEAVVTVREDASVSVELTFTTLQMMGGILGNAQSVAIYQTHEATGDAVMAEVVSVRNANYGFPGSVKEHEVLEKIRFTLPFTDQKGVFAKMEVDAMKTMGMASVDAYFEFDYANAIEKVDKSKLEVLLEIAGSKVESQYTTESFASFFEVLAEVRGIYEQDVVSQVAIDEAYQKLEQAMNALVVIGDKAPLQDALAVAKTYKETSYTVSSYERLKTAMIDAQQILDNEKPTIERIEQAIDALETAITGLKVRGITAALESKLVVAKDKDATLYTTATYTKLQETMTKAQELLASQDATQEMVDQMVQELEAALQQLQTIKTETTDKTDKPDTTTGTNSTNTQTPTTSTTSTTQKVVRTVDEVEVALWHESKDQASMASNSIKSVAQIVTENDVATMTIYTQPLQMGSLTGYLLGMKVSGTQAKVVSVDANQKPTALSFVLPSTEQTYLDVEVSADVMTQMMGVEYLGARLKINWDTKKRISTTTVSEDGQESTTNSATSATSGGASNTQTTTTTSSGSTSVSAVKTGDETDIWAYLGLLSVTGLGLGIVLLKNIIKRKGMRHE